MKFLNGQMKESHVKKLEAESPPPPQGYASWLDYAVDTMDTRSAELDCLINDSSAEGAPQCEAMRQAVKAELEELRRRAGIRGQQRLSELMAEMPEGLPRADGWET